MANEGTRTRLEKAVEPLRRHAARDQAYNIIATAIVDTGMLVFNDLKAELLHEPALEEDGKPSKKKAT